MRLIDYAIQNGIQPFTTGDLLSAEFMQLDADTVPIVIDNVAVSIFGTRETGPTELGTRLSDEGFHYFPSVAPVFPNCLVEYVDPLAAQGTWDMIGVHCLQGEHMERWMERNIDPQRRQSIWDMFHTDAKFRYLAVVYERHVGVRVLRGPRCAFLISGAEDGSFLQWGGFSSTPGYDASFFMDNYMTVVCAVWMSFSFLTCKNVRRDLSPDVPVTRQQRRLAARKPGSVKPLLRYWTLDIGPMTALLESEGGASKNGIKKAMHICRGHFNTYTEENPDWRQLDRPVNDN